MTGNAVRILRKIIGGNPLRQPCIAHLPDTNFWHYSLQLNTYKYMLEKNYGKKVTDMYLVCLHPNNYNQSYIRLKVPELPQEIEDLMQLRREMVNKKLTLEAAE